MKALLILFSLILVTDAFSSYTGPNPNFNSVSIDTSLKGDEITTPSTPPSNVWKLYFKTSGLYVMDDVGTEYDLMSFVPTSRTISTTAPLSGGGDLSANRTISIPKADTSTDGYLDDVDWDTFNDKIGKSGTYVDNCVMRSDGTTNLAQCGSGVTLSDTGILENLGGIFTGSVNANLMMDIVSTTKASRPCPTMDTTQRDALTAQTGSCIYNSTTSSYQFYNGTSWGDIGGGVSAAALNASKVYFRATQNDTETCWDADAVATIVYETESVDTNNIHSSGVITIPSGKAGLWCFRACADVTTPNPGCYQTALQTTADSIYVRGDCFVTGVDDSGVQLAGSCVEMCRVMSVGNTVEVRGLGSDNNNQNCGTSSSRNYFEAFYYGSNTQF